MRVCSELENLLLEVTLGIIWKQKIEWLRNKKEKKHTDFSDYLYLLDEEVDLSSKKIKFIADIEIREVGSVKWFDQGIYIQPFWRNWNLWDGNIPLWWKNYNWIKHSKFDFYDECNLWNVRDALAAYYIALMYYVFWYNQELYISSIPYNDPTKNNAHYNKYWVWMKFEENIETDLFEVTSCAWEFEIKEIINWRKKIITKKNGKLQSLQNTVNVKESLFYSYNLTGSNLIGFVNKKTNI